MGWDREADHGFVWRQFSLLHENGYKDYEVQLLLSSGELSGMQVFLTSWLQISGLPLSLPPSLCQL